MTRTTPSPPGSPATSPSRWSHAGIIGGAALGMAGLANAQTEPVGPGYQYSPTTTAAPAPTALSRAGLTTTACHHVETLVPGYTR